VKNGKNLAALQERLGYRFKREALLVRAMTHRSFLFEHDRRGKGDNETLEFLGDAVLDLVVGSMLFKRYPKMDEGDLTKVRSTLVQEKHLALLAAKLDIGQSLLLGKGESRSGGASKDSILSCAFEAVMGAVFVDGGYEAASMVVHALFEDRLEYGRCHAVNDDPKSHLQEITQKLNNEAPSYTLVGEDGPDHDKTFTVEVSFQGRVLAVAAAGSKKAAERKAAAEALKNF